MKYVINIIHINSKNNAVTKRVSVNELNLTGCPGSDFAFPDTNVVMALLAMLTALRLVAGSKHAPRAFGRAIWQAGSRNTQNQPERAQSELSELT